jgi:hypothetical protein
MTLSISPTVSAQPAYTPSSPAPAAAQQAQRSQPTDTVELSESAQVSQMYEQGQSPSLIAENLGVPVSLVDMDLGIIATNAASAPTAPVAASAIPTATTTKSTSP